MISVIVKQDNKGDRESWGQSCSSFEGVRIGFSEEGAIETRLGRELEQNQ